MFKSKSNHVFLYLHVYNNTILYYTMLYYTTLHNTVLHTTPKHNSKSIDKCINTETTTTTTTKTRVIKVHTAEY